MWSPRTTSSYWRTWTSYPVPRLTHSSGIPLAFARTPRPLHAHAHAHACTPMCMYLRGARCRSAARAQVVLPPERLPAASLLYFLPLRLQPQAPTRTPTLARTPTTALTPTLTLTLTLTLTRRLGGSHTWNAPVIVRRADVPSGFDFVKFPFAKKKDWASSGPCRKQAGAGFGQLALRRPLSAGADRGQITPQAAPGSGPPRAISCLGGSDRPHRACSRHR